ncbi:hypothetical protein LOTGIDRAFT_171051 [Lottia gigantea]|uniref:IGFBP N-terminal domain-containing protein n=1 Tax=Lottia gigantea TaxID=225164 RepID=V4B1J0_LOTGI|nr:hypothetical protein LOTGIDRAFT_171051 [Lottia gigantea]ESP04213.1 hypothetical protein LOTGIDRAFT_171051 [Lottia gigantea]
MVIYVLLPIGSENRCAVTPTKLYKILKKCAGSVNGFILKNDVGGCKPCPAVPNCAPLSRKYCVVKRRPCGCCDECAGRHKDPCDRYSVPCDDQFECVNDKGYGLKHIENDLDFHGVCRFRARKGQFPYISRRSRPYIIKG